MPIAVDDKPLSADPQKLALQRLREEVARRSHEASREARQRAEQYGKMREGNARISVETSGSRATHSTTPFFF
jgi:hypothetical protein